MKYRDVFVSKDQRFSVGVEEPSGRYYLSIPLSNSMVDYEAYYQLTPELFSAYSADPALAFPFVERCRRRECDDLLLMQPGRDRGVAQ